MQGIEFFSTSSVQRLRTSSDTIYTKALGRRGFFDHHQSDQQIFFETWKADHVVVQEIERADNGELFVALAS